MAGQLEQSSKEDDLKTQFLTREGTYRLMNLSEYSRPNRVGYTSNQSSPMVRVSLVSMPEEPGGSSSAATGSSAVINGHSGDDLLQVNQISSTTTPSPSVAAVVGLDHQQHPLANGPGRHLANNHQQQHVFGPCGGDRICFNFGKELFVYPYRGMKKTGPDINKPIDKKLYKGTNPSCHDFNAATATPDSAMLLIGFTTGQIQLVQPGRREPGKLFNEDRLIDKSKVTCLKWLPGSPNLFLAGHSSGHLYLYNEELSCVPTPPHYQAHKLGDGFSVHTCKSKVARNPVHKWTFGTGTSPTTTMDNGSINEFAFSPCGLNLAIASQDGFLRVFRYESMELLGIARSYFGGFLCVCWSPDGKYIVVGGEDDLVTIWSMQERRVVARGQGHRSWVSVVAFDPYTTSYGVAGDGEGSYEDPYVSDDDGVSALYRNAAGPRSNDQINNNKGSSGSASGPVISNRGGEEFYSSSSSNKMSNGGGIPSNSRSSGRRKSSSVRPRSVSVSGCSTSYRLGSVSQDTQLCLWDITEDVLKQPVKMFRQSVNSPTQAPEKSSGGSLRIEVKPSQGTAGGGVGAAAVAGTSNIHNNFSSSSTNNNNNNTGQTPASSLSSISSSNNNNNDKVDGTVLARDKDVVAVAVQLPSGKGEVEQDKAAGTTTTTTAVTTTTTQVGGGSNNNNTSSSSSSKLKSGTGGTGGISLIGNCVGNNLNKMTMSSSISSISSTASGGGDGEDIVGGAAPTAGPSSSSSTKAIGNGAKSSTDSTSSSSGMMTLNAFTQRLSHFSFGNDKKNGDGGHQQQQQQNQGKKGFTLSKPFGGGSNSISKSATTTSGQGSRSEGGAHGGGGHHSSAHGAAGEHRLAVTIFDPIKLIGSTACPRFDECPVLEPLICKKIAHERLTALIFREDCFLTACQDGIIYTWARPPPFEKGNKLQQT